MIKPHHYVFRHLPRPVKEAIRNYIYPPIPNEFRVPIISKAGRKNSNNAVVMVDMRPQLNLELILNDHMRFLPGWDSVIFTCQQNRYLHQWCSHLVELPDDWGYSIRRYSQLLCSPIIWKTLLELGYDRCLCIQTDTKLLRSGIEEFLEWDWVGAPWPPDTYDDVEGMSVGNGGLSLRSVPKMFEISKLHKWEGYNEDVFFCRYLLKGKGKVAPLSVSKRFSCEKTFALGTLGCHSIHRYLTPEQICAIMTQYL